MKTKKDAINQEASLLQGEGLILVVDDEPIMRKIAINVLENCGYTVIAVENGEKAIDIYKLRHHEITLVLLDLLMPNKCGQQTYFEMKNINPDIKAILISGAKKDKRIEELLQSGVKGYIEKPYTFLYLSQKVHEVIYQHS